MRLLILTSALMLFTLGAVAGQREDFLAAEQAFKRGDRVRFAALAETLRDYPLYPYLRFTDLSAHLETAAESDIEAFLAADPDSQLAARLRIAWLRRLAAASRWSDYARLYRPDDSVERRCLDLRS